MIIFDFAAGQCLQALDLLGSDVVYRVSCKLRLFDWANWYAALIG
jgi:hypothetical protein